ncbi:MAG: hypothetical protein H0T62_08255 [Parachlamydiaceae bacterium]|nr:hypothetical protein [Parachlamydiaceae bacterium]
MKTQRLFLYTLSMLCCLGAVNANDVEIEAGERITVGERSLSDSETVALYEARLNSFKLDEELKEGQEGTREDALQTAPMQEILAASQAAKALFQKQGLNEATAQISKKGITTHPGVFHFSVGFSGNTIGLEDGSWWKAYSGDMSITKNWVTSLGSFTPDSIIIEPNLNWPSYSNYRYYLTNQQTSKSVRVNLSLAPFYNGTYTHYIHSYTYIVDSYGFLYVQLCLNDGSIWNMLTDDYPITSLWKVNDTVILGCNSGVYSAIAPNILINVNTNNYGAGACVTK